MKSEKKFNYNDVKRAIDQANLLFLGQLGLAKAGVIHIDLFNDNKGILKVNNKSLNEVKMSMSLIKEISNEKAIIDTIGVSGILNKAQKKMIQ